MERLTAAQMRAVERAAIDSGAVTGLELMERAGRGAVDAILDWRPELAQAPGRALVLCGPGNNGGDGFVMARVLAGRGWEVELFLFGDAAKAPADAAENIARWRRIGEVRPWDDAAVEAALDSRRHDLVVDALFGIGLTRGMPADTAGALRGFLRAREEAGPGRLVAVDMPSGLSSDTGENLGGAFPADLTVTFHRAKPGQFRDRAEVGRKGGVAWCGTVKVVDIGLGR